MLNKTNAMIDPEEDLILPDEPENDPEDQQSQQDVHSDGVEADEEAATASDNIPDIEGLKAADKASEASYTLDVDKGIAPKQKPKEDTNLKD